MKYLCTFFVLSLAATVSLRAADEAAGSPAPVAMSAEFHRSWQERRDRQPAWMQVKATLPKDHFHIGEVIPVELAVSSARNDLDHYSFSDGNIEVFGEGAEGSPVANPLQWYYDHYMQVNSRPSSERMIRPWVFTLAANFALRFDKPGTYTFYVVLQGMEPGSDKGPDGKPITPPVPVSDPIRIKIEPRRTPAEEQAVIDQAKAILAAAPERDFIPEIDPAFDAVERLRFLDTPAAAEALLPYIGTVYGEEAVRGLYARPDYAAIAAKILVGVKGGTLRISNHLLYFYRDLKSGGDFPLFGNPSGEANEKAARAELMDAAAQAAAVTDKGRLNFENLASVFREDPHDAATRALLVKNQLDLPQKQIDLLLNKDEFPFVPIKIEKARVDDVEEPLFDTSHFPQPPEQGTIADKDFLPLLRELVKPEKHDAYALAVLATLAPDEARPIIIEDLKRDHPIYIPTGGHVYFSAANALFAHRALPDAKLPELDPILREKLNRRPMAREDDVEATMVLIERYATEALLPDVIRVYQPKEGRWSCVLETAALRYWIRCDPAGGVGALQRALQHHGPEDSGCFHNVLREVLSAAWTPAALPLVHSALENDDAEVVSGTVHLLAAHDPGAETNEQIVTAVERLATMAGAKSSAEVISYEATPGALIEFLLRRRKGPALTRAQLLGLKKVVKEEWIQRHLQEALAKEGP